MSGLFIFNNVIRRSIKLSTTDTSRVEKTTVATIIWNKNIVTSVYHSTFHMFVHTPRNVIKFMV